MCLFPAMHHVPLHDDRTIAVVGAAAAIPGAVVFVHCGVLSVGVREKLGLPSRFDLRLGDPLGGLAACADVPAYAVHRAAFRRRTVARGADGRGRLPPTSISTRRARTAGFDTRQG